MGDERDLNPRPRACEACDLTTACLQAGSRQLDTGPTVASDRVAVNHRIGGSRHLSS